MNRIPVELDKQQHEELLTTDQVAERLQISRKTVRKWRYEGSLPAVKVGRRLVRYRWPQVLEWLELQGGKN